MISCDAQTLLPTPLRIQTHHALPAHSLRLEEAQVISSRPVRYTLLTADWAEKGQKFSPFGAVDPLTGLSIGPELGIATAAADEDIGGVAFDGTNLSGRARATLWSKPDNRSPAY